jgi:hypothetical protein
MCSREWLVLYCVRDGYVVCVVFVGEWRVVGGDVFKSISKMAL